ncbi:substrate-binding domain-containing protein [Halosimplex aquaticum]
MRRSLRRGRSRGPSNRVDVSRTPPNRDRTTVRVDAHLHVRLLPAGEHAALGRNRGVLVEPIARAAALWNGNSLPTDETYGGTPADRIGSSGPGFAGYFARRHGFSPTETPNRPPYRVAVGENDGPEALAALRAETADVATLRAETTATVASEMDVSGLVRHDLFRTGTAVVVSDAVYRTGVRSISREELLGVYNARITNWRSLGGPDREIHLIGAVDGDHPEIFEQTFLEDEPRAASTNATDSYDGRSLRSPSATTRWPEFRFETSRVSVPVGRTSTGFSTSR